MSLIDDADSVLKEIEKSSSEDIQLISSKLGQDVMSGKLQLVKVVEILGPLLTNTDIKHREKGVTVLVQMLSVLRSDFLSKAELTFLTAFLCDRLKDHHSLASVVLQGILTLIDMDDLPGDSPIIICTSLFSNIHCQTLTQPERNMMYRIFQKFLSYKIEDIRPLGIDFVLGFITAIDSERDPQNLLLLFSTLPTFLAWFPLLHLTEEAFSVISCYFPIDFNAADDDRAKAQARDELAAALAPCLVAVPQFAEFCIPLVIEKLDSSLRIAKLDSLAVLKEGCRIWPMENIEPHLLDIWLSLKKELLPGNDMDVRNLATETLSTLIVKLDDIPVKEKRHSLLQSFADDVLSSTTGLLSDMNLSLFGPAVHVLVTVASASKFVCEKIISHVITKLYALPQTTPQDTVIVIRTLNLFFEAELRHNTKEDEFNEVWLVLPEMLLSASNHTNADVQVAAFEGLATLTPMLSETCRRKIYNNCQAPLRNENRLVMNGCIKCLKRLAELYPVEVMTNVVESHLLIDKGIKGTGMEMETEMAQQRWRVETLCALLMVPDYMRPVSDILLALIDSYSSCTPIILKTIRTLLESSSWEDAVIRPLCEIYTKRLVTWWVNGQTAQQARCPQIFNNEDTLKDCAAIVESLIRPQTSKMQTELTSPLLQMMVPADEPGNGLSSSLTNDITGRIRLQVLLLEGLLESLHQDVVLVGWQTLTMALTNLAFNSSQKVTQLSASRLLATLLNKQQNDEKLAAVLGHVAKGLEQKLNERNTEINAVRLLSWITKALVLRGHSLMSYWLDKLTDQLSSRRIGKEAADGFRLIMSEDKLHLTTKSHCTVRILYRQRLFQRMPSLVSASRSCHPNCKVNYLLAIAHFVQSVPRVVLLPYLRQVVLPMVESLDYDEGELELTTLETLSSLLCEKEPSLESYTDTFIPAFINLAQQSPFMKVRVAALDCLRNYANYPPVLLMPYAQTVIAELETCLDDKKRLVRRAAVAARCAWFLIGESDDD